jgi:hypothetical protein
MFLFRGRVPRAILSAEGKKTAVTPVIQPPKNPFALAAFMDPDILPELTAALLKYLTPGTRISGRIE